MKELFWFTDEQWSWIEPLIPQNTRILKRVDDRRVLSGIAHVLKSDGKRHPNVMMLTPGQVSDHKERNKAAAQDCLAVMPLSKELLVDKGYGSKALRA